jgi:hypothetical protein
MNLLPTLFLLPCLLLGQATERLSLDGDPLGMTLARFKAKYPNASVDPFRGVGYVARQESLKPRFAYKNPYPVVKGKAADTAYFFSPSPGGPDEARLFSILFSFEAAKYPELKQTYTAQYGAPASVEKSMVQNQAGYSFEAETATWRLGTGWLVLRQRSTPRYDRGMLDLRDEEFQGGLDLKGPAK